MEEQKRGYMERLEALEVGQKKQDEKLNEILMAQSVMLNSLSGDYVESMESATSPEEKLHLMLNVSALNSERDRCADLATGGSFSDEQKETEAKKIYMELLKFFK